MPRHSVVKGRRRATAIFAAASLLAPMACGCFGSELRARGNRRAAAGVAALEVAGCCLIALGVAAAVVCSQDESLDEPVADPLNFFVPVFAGAIPIAGGVTLIWLGESRYGATYRPGADLARFDDLRGETPVPGDEATTSGEGFLQGPGPAAAVERVREPRPVSARFMLTPNGCALAYRF